MANIENVLNSRLSQGESKERRMKVRELAHRSNSGSLSSFSTLFGSSPLSQEERENMRSLLEMHIHQEMGKGQLQHGHAIDADVQELSQIASEIKSISHQSILLHGERIKKAQAILASYREGAFSAWLIAVYGNRQTPYNFLLYYELYSSLEGHLRQILERMPKQAVYTLASRKADHKEKVSIITSYQGQTKDELLQEIRSRFPLLSHDKRKKSPFHSLKQIVHTLNIQCQKSMHELTPKEKNILRSNLLEISQALHDNSDKE